MNEQLWLAHLRYFEIRAEGILDEKCDRKERIERLRNRQNRQVCGHENHADRLPLRRRVHGDAGAQRAAENDDFTFGACRKPVERRDAIGQQPLLARRAGRSRTRRVRREAMRQPIGYR